MCNEPDNKDLYYRVQAHHNKQTAWKRNPHDMKKVCVSQEKDENEKDPYQESKQESTASYIILYEK